MLNKIKIIAIYTLFLTAVSPVQAQVAYPDLTNVYGQNIGPLTPQNNMGMCNPNPTIGICQFSGAGGPYVNAVNYGNSIYNAANAYTDSKITNLNGGGISQANLSQQLMFVVTSFDNAIRRQNSYLSQGIAMASAIEVLPPNTGDRFAVNVGGAGYNGQGAGSVSATVRVTDNVLGYVGYARSINQNLVKGGFSVSIH